jgi:prepilin-type N-terminal cleavage/methylation domain-containing protein
MLWLRKSKKGFTLIELMVVVAIIGVLSLLGLRLYSGQQVKAKNAIVKANMGTVQTLIQAELADTPNLAVAAAQGLGLNAALHNPFSGNACIATDFTTAQAGATVVAGVAGGPFTVTGYGKSGAAADQLPNPLTAQK